MRMRRNGKGQPEPFQIPTMTNVEAYHFAQELVKKAGFALHVASMRSEACYYSHPARAPLLLRLATHKSKRSLIGMRASTVARLTLRDNAGHYYSEEHVRNMLAMAIGRYFMNDPRPSEYFGKKGTWESEGDRV
jgi:hypothetical protein